MWPFSKKKTPNLFEEQNASRNETEARPAQSAPRTSSQERVAVTAAEKEREPDFRERQEERREERREEKKERTAPVSKEEELARELGLSVDEIKEAIDPQASRSSSSSQSSVAPLSTRIAAAGTVAALEDLQNEVVRLGSTNERRTFFSKMISLVKNLEEARAVFKMTERESAEEKEAVKKALSFATNIDEIASIFEITAEDTESFELVYRAYSAAVSNFDEAKELYDAYEGRKESFERWMSFAESVEQVEAVYQWVSDDEYEEATGKKMALVVAARLKEMKNFDQALEFARNFFSEISDYFTDARIEILSKLLGLAGTSDQMQEICNLANDDSDVWDRIGKALVARWLPLADSVEVLTNIIDDLDIGDELEKIVEGRMETVFSSQLAKANTYEKAKELFMDVSSDELELLAVRRMILMASSLDEIRDVYDSYSFGSGQDEQRELVKKWITLAESLDEFDDMPLDDLDEDNAIKLEVQEKAKGLLLKKLSVAESFYDLKDVVENDFADDQVKMTGVEKMFGKVSDGDEAKELFVLSLGSRFEVAAARKMLPFFDSLGDFQEVYDDYQIDDESKAVIVDYWDRFALSIIQSINSPEEAKRIIPQLPEEGQARNELIRKMYRSK